MTFRRLDAELTLDSTPYAASLRAASVQTRTFSAEAVAAGKEIQGGYEGATTGAKTYAAVVAESATANVEARVKEGASLVALRAEYAAIADAAVKGSAEQIAANKLVEESNVKLAASGVEVAASQGLMSGVGEKLGGVFEQLGLRVERSHGLVGAALKGMTSDMSTMGVGVGAAVGVVGAAFGVLAIEGVKHFQEVTGEIRQFQRIAGTSAQDSSALVYAFKELGIAPEVAAKSIGLFSRNLVDHADKVEAAGVAIAHLKNGNVDTIGSLFNLADAFQRVGPGAEGTTLALDLLGRGGAALIPVLQRGREGLREFFAEASAHGLIFSQKDIDDGKALTLATRDLHEAFSGFEISLARDVIPQLTSLAHGFSAVTDAVTNMHIPVVPLLEAGAAAYTASKAMVALGAGLTAVGAEAAGATVAGLAGVTGGAVLAAGAFVAVASTVDKNVPAMKRLDDSFINAERHIPLVGNALANLDQHLPGVTHHTDEHSAAALAQSAAMASVGLTLTAFDDTLDKSETSMSNLTEAHKAEMAESVRHEKALTGAAQSIGLSEEGLVRAIGFAGQSNIATWAAEEAAATKFAAAVTQGENAASASFAKTIDAVGAFSASSLLSADKAAASSTRAADTIVADDTRVADAVQHVADLQEQYAAKATSDRQAYADKVTSADEAMTAADASYADTVDTTNQRIADADRKLAEDRISGAQSVADAEKRLEDDRVSGQQSVADLQQKLADDTERQALARNPAALARFNNTLQLRDARAAIAKAQDSASDKEKADVDAIAKAKAAALKTERTDQEAADKARSDGAKAVEKAEDGVTAARAAQNKLAAEANTIGVESLAQQTEMRKAIEAVGKAQTTSATQAVTSSVAATTAVKLTTEQVAEFYKTSIADSERFTDEIHSAIEKGYDPAFIARLMEEGPKEAQPVLALIAGQTDDTFRDMVNNGEKKLAQLKLYTADMNHAVEIAANTSNATIRGDFDLAMKALAVLAANGGHMTVQALADALQTGPAIILRISGEYGGAMAAGINPLLAGIGAPTIDAASMAKYGADRSYFMATGGHVPGHGQGDTVPAMLTPGEYVISKPAVDRLGVDNLDQMHKVARRGYAAGGFVTAADVPPVPDFSAYGTALGYSATKADEFERAKVIDYLNGRAAAKGKGSGGSGYGFQALIDYLDNQGIPNQVTSTTGGGHAEGSRHYMGLAADFVSDDMDQIGRAFMGIQGSMYELIHNPGFSVKGGQQVDPGFWGSDTWGQHTDHVHAATYKDSAEGPGIPTAGGTASSGGKVYQGQVADWVAAGVALAGKPDSWDYPEVNIAMFESGGDPNAQNNWDSNAAAGHPSKGLMQMIDSTFQAYMVPGHGDIWNPIDNAASATGYIAADYGDPWHTPGELSIAKGGAYQGYELGGLVAGLSMGVMDKGGYLEPGWNLNYNGLGVREPVGAMAGGGGGQAAAAGGDIHVHFAINGLAVGTTKQFADMLAEPLRSVVVRRWRGNTGNFFDGR